MRLKWFAEERIEPLLESCTVSRNQAPGEGEACPGLAQRPDARLGVVPAEQPVTRDGHPAPNRRPVVPAELFPSPLAAIHEIRPGTMVGGLTTMTERISQSKGHAKSASAWRSVRFTVSVSSRPARGGVAGWHSRRGRSNRRRSGWHLHLPRLKGSAMCSDCARYSWRIPT